MPQWHPHPAPESALTSFVHQSEITMLRWSVTLFIIALVAAVLGFGGIAGAAAGIAKILFVIFLVLFVISLIAGKRVIA